MSRTQRFVHPRDHDACCPKFAEGRDGAARSIATQAYAGRYDAWATANHGKGKAAAKDYAQRMRRRHERRELTLMLATEL